MKPKKDGEYPNNLASFFIHFLLKNNLYDENILEYQFGNPIKVSPEKKHIDTSKTIPIISEIVDSKNIKIAQREALMWGTLQQEAIAYGNVVHEILSYVKTKADVAIAITKAIENGLITVNQQATVLKTIQDIVNHNELKDFFAIENKILNEQTIIQKEGNMIKPDRMAISKDKKVYLIDYKTGVHQPKYQTQLENYQVAIEKMGYIVSKKALVYIGEDIKVVNL